MFFIYFRSLGHFFGPVFLIYSVVWIRSTGPVRCKIGQHDVRKHMRNNALLGHTCFEFEVFYLFDKNVAHLDDVLDTSMKMK